MRVIVRKERPHPGAQLRFTDLDGHRFTAFATDTKRPARRPGTTAPPTGQMRGPHPLRQGHRPAEPAPQGLRPEPNLMRDRGPGLRAAGLDAAARPDRDRPPLGAEAAPPALVRRRRPPRPRRPPPQATARRTMALGWRGHRRHHPPAGPPGRLTSQTAAVTRKGQHQGPWNPAHPARQPGSQARPGPEKQPQPGTLGQDTCVTKHRG